MLVQSAAGLGDQCARECEVDGRVPLDLGPVRLIDIPYSV